MEWTGLNELRETFLSFFESKGHMRLPSFSLIPKDDNSLLLINSGMAPMKKYFTGEVTPPSRRVTTCQKCIRTPDIDRVGITARHGTFFEMLGNFSFGDYFKHEATAWAWELCTKVLKLPEDRLWVTIYLDDDEAFDIWTKEVGVSPKKIVRLGKEDNFWEHGPGPCGPCSEIYFDRGEKYGCGKPTCGVGCDCDRYVEFWNVVFSQFESDGNGNYPPMEHPNIDTGMGLERLACIMQGVDNLFLVDTMQNIMKHIIDISGVKYGYDPKSDVSLRVITDHVRSTTFMIGDGVLPSNEGRGYVLRRLLRRAARHGRLIGINDTFLYKVCSTVINENKSAYPELYEKRDMITKLIRAEEESFAKTIDQGTQLLGDYIKSTVKSGRRVFSGIDAFKLSDTYGFPIDLTKEIAAESGLTVDEEEFEKQLKSQKERARAARRDAGADAWAGENGLLDGVKETEFSGYENFESESKVLALIKDGQLAKSVSAGDEVTAVLDKTPFYGESGGQVGDTGIIESSGAVLKVTGTTKNHAKNYLHHAVVEAGGLSVGDSVKACVDVERRLAVMRNHTCAHLLQAALRRVLGTHVEQAGQLVDERLVRFDFTHFSAMTDDEIKKTEELVNGAVLSGMPVTCKEMPVEEAKKSGAMALFGEKYGKIVRVVSAGDFSKEFCGGTHVDNTAKIGMFKIISESSAAAGVRRIEAVTGTNTAAWINGVLNEEKETAAALKVNSISELPQKARQLSQELKEKNREIEKLGAELAALRMESLLASAKEINGVKLITAEFSGVKPDGLRAMCDSVRDSSPDMAAVLAGVSGGKASIAVCAGKNAVKRGVHAGSLAREVAKAAGGSGGGRPDSAMAGAKDVSKLGAALASAEVIVAEMVK